MMPSNIVERAVPRSRVASATCKFPLCFSRKSQRVLIAEWLNHAPRDLINWLTRLRAEVTRIPTHFRDPDRLRDFCSPEIEGLRDRDLMRRRLCDRRFRISVARAHHKCPRRYEQHLDPRCIVAYSPRQTSRCHALASLDIRDDQRIWVLLKSRRPGEWRRTRSPSSEHNREVGMIDDSIVIRVCARESAAIRPHDRENDRQIGRVRNTALVDVGGALRSRFLGRNPKWNQESDESCDDRDGIGAQGQDGSPASGLSTGYDGDVPRPNSSFEFVGK